MVNNLSKEELDEILDKAVKEIKDEKLARSHPDDKFTTTTRIKQVGVWPPQEPPQEPPRKPPRKLSAWEVLVSNLGKENP